MSPFHGFGGRGASMTGRGYFGGRGGYGRPPGGLYYGPRERLVEVAPVLANPLDNVTVRDFALDGNTLSATIDVDGQIYQGSLDLGQLASVVGDRVAAYHAQLHQLAAQSAAQPSGSPAVAQDAVVASGVAQAASAEQQAALTLAGVALVGSLVDKHIAKHDAMCAGWFDSITDAVSSAAKGVYHAGEAGYHGITHTWKKLKAPIQIAATAFGGPAAGALAGTVIDAANGDIGSKQALAQVRANAAINPEIQKNLTKATAAAAKATAAYHVVDTIGNAAQGDPAAGQQVQQLLTSAAGGDPSAQSALELAQVLLSMGGPQATQAAATAVSGIASSLRHEAAHAAASGEGTIIGYINLNGNPSQVHTFKSVDDADDWFGQWLRFPYAFHYVAYYDKRDPSFPGPLNEAFGKTPPWRDAQVSGWLPWLTGAAGFAAGYFEPQIAGLARDGWAKLKAIAPGPGSR